MPVNLENTLDELEAWASDNQRDARRDILAFWALKIPAILASGGAGVIAYYEIPAVSAFVGAIASICIIIDGIHPRGMLRNTHLCAVHDLRLLNAKMMNQWRTRDPRLTADNAARRIIQEAEKERERIGCYLRDAETALNPSPRLTVE